MSDNRSNRRVSILKIPGEATGSMNQTKGDGANRRVSFNRHGVRHQVYNAGHGILQQETKSEYFTMSSISSADEASRNLTRNPENNDNRERVPLRTLDTKKTRESVGLDATRNMFEKSGHGNLTLQFGPRPSANSTFVDENTQGMFDAPDQEMNCTEAFFEQIQSTRPIGEGVLMNQGKKTSLSDDTEDFLGMISSQQRAANIASPQTVTILDENSDEKFSAEHVQTTSMSEKIVEHCPQGGSFENSIVIDQTASQCVIIADNTTLAIDQGKGSPAAPEISSYVFHENSEDPCKLGQHRTFQSLIDFNDTDINFTKKVPGFNESKTSPPVISEECMFEDMSPEGYQNFELSKDMSTLITMYSENQIAEQRGEEAQPTSEFVLESSRVLQLQLGEKLNQTVEMLDETDQMATQSIMPHESVLCKTYEVPVRSPNLTYVVPTPVLKAKPDDRFNSTTTSTTLDTSVLNESIDGMFKMIGETREKLEKFEGRRRASVSFTQKLNEAMLNRSMEQVSMEVEHDPVLKEPEQSSCPPVKQARINPTMDSPKTATITSVAVPTATQQTPQPALRKSQQSKDVFREDLSNASKMSSGKMSTPTRKVGTALRSMPNLTPIVTPQVSMTTMRRSIVPGSILKNFNTPKQFAPVQPVVEINPLHGPVKLRFADHIKWIQELKSDPEWLNDDDQVSKWNPLSEDYLDKHGPTAGKEKTDFQQEADRIVVQAINKHCGNMDKVRIEIFEMGKVHVESIRPYRTRMWGLVKEYEEKVKHYNSRVHFHNELVRNADKKKHADIEEFIVNIKLRIQGVIDELNSDSE